MASFGAIIIGATYFLILWVSAIFSPALAWLVPLAYFIIGVFFILYAFYKPKTNYVVLIVGVALAVLGIATLASFFWRALLGYLGIYV